MPPAILINEYDDPVAKEVKMNRNRFREIFMYGIMNSCLGPNPHRIQSSVLRDILSQMDRLVMRSGRNEEILSHDESKFVGEFNMNVNFTDCVCLDGCDAVGTCRIENPLNIISWVAGYFCRQISETVGNRKPTFSEAVLMEMLGSIELAAANESDFVSQVGF